MGGTAVRRIGAWMAMVAMPLLTWGFILTTHQAAGRTTGSLGVEALVTVGFASFGAAVTGYLTLVSAAVALVAPFGRGRAVRSVAQLAPAAWRRLAATAVGVTIVSSATIPAFAQPDVTSPVDWLSDPMTPAEVVDMAPEDISPVDVGGVGIEVAIDPFAAPPVEVASASVVENYSHAPSIERPMPVPPPVAEEPSPPTYVVTRGDSLWAIAAAALGESATTADIASAWQLLYAENTEVIGPDPGLIFAGQELTLPEALR